MAGVEGKDWCIFFFSEGFSGVHIRCGVTAEDSAWAGLHSLLRGWGS